MSFMDEKERKNEKPTLENRNRFSTEDRSHWTESNEAGYQKRGKRVRVSKGKVERRKTTSAKGCLSATTKQAKSQTPSLP